MAQTVIPTAQTRRDTPARQTYIGAIVKLTVYQKRGKPSEIDFINSTENWHYRCMFNTEVVNRAIVEELDMHFLRIELILHVTPQVGNLAKARRT